MDTGQTQQNARLQRGVIAGSARFDVGMGMDSCMCQRQAHEQSWTQKHHCQSSNHHFIHQYHCWNWLVGWCLLIWILFLPWHWNEQALCTSSGAQSHLVKEQHELKCQMQSSILVSGWRYEGIKYALQYINGQSAVSYMRIYCLLGICLLGFLIIITNHIWE